MSENAAFTIRENVWIAIKYCYQSKFQEAFGLLASLQINASLAGADKDLAYIMWAIGYCWYHVALESYYSGNIPGQIFIPIQTCLMTLNSLSKAGKSGKFAVASMMYLKGQILMLQSNPRDAIAYFEQALDNYDLDDKFIKLDWEREKWLAYALGSRDGVGSLKKFDAVFALARENKKFFSEDVIFNLFVVTGCINSIQAYNVLGLDFKKRYRETLNQLEKQLKMSNLFTTRYSHILALGKKIGLDVNFETVGGGNCLK